MAATKINTNLKRLFQIGWIIINAIWLFSARLHVRRNTELGCRHGCQVAVYYGMSVDRSLKILRYVRLVALHRYMYLTVVYSNVQLLQ